MSYSPNAKMINSKILWTPTCGLTGTDLVTGIYFRTGNILNGYIKAHWSGAATGTELTFTLPSGLTTSEGNYAASGTSNIPTVISNYGYGAMWNLASWVSYPTWVLGKTTSSIVILNNASPRTSCSPTVPFTIGADDWGEWQVSIPIVEWS